jgi:hypothetical protein
MWHGVSRKVYYERRADNFIVICEYVIKKIWELRRLTALFSAACYSDNISPFSGKYCIALIQSVNASQWTAFSSGFTWFSVFNTQKRLSFEGSFHHKKEWRNQQERERERERENRVGSSSLQHCLWLEMSSLPWPGGRGGQGHCGGTRTDFLPSVRNCGPTRGMCFNNLPITSTQKALLALCPAGANSSWITPCLPRNGISIVWSRTSLNEAFGPLWGPLWSLDVPSLGRHKYPWLTSWYKAHNRIGTLLTSLVEECRLLGCYVVWLL